MTDVDQSGAATLVDTVPGTGRLASYAEAIASVKGTKVRLWAEVSRPS